MNASQFFTEINIEKSKWNITHNDNILLIGSCFTNEIGNKFDIYGFKTAKNPFGILYNPKSIAVCINRIVNNDFLTQKDIIQNGEYFFPFSAHGDYKGVSEEDCLNKINTSISLTNTFLHNTTIIIITFGSSWTYWYSPLNYLMGNCHKIHSELIQRKMLQINDIVDCMNETIENTHTKINQNIKFIFTISPVRHWKEGWADNSLSKSVLRIAVDEIVKNNKNNAYYFPSYEIVMDELRDYRFYSKDLIHINDIAVDYIWQKFSSTYFCQEDIELNEKYFKLFQMKNHKPFNPNSDGYKKHLEKIRQLEDSLK